MNKTQMNKARMQKAKRAGMSPIDVAKMHEIARKEARKAETEYVEKAFLFMLAIPLNVLVSDYWPKSAKQKAPKFIEDVASLFESVQNGTVSEQELADLLYEMAGVNITAEWMKAKGCRKNVNTAD